MPRRSHIKTICALLVSGLLICGFPATDAIAQKSGEKQQQGGMTSREAADKARAQHGGKVLKVTRKGKGYRVKLLQDSGRVITVTVKD